MRNASADLEGFARELQVLDRGQVLVSTSFRDVALPVQVPDFDELGEREKLRSPTLASRGTG